jgi:hypothetical protein
MTCEQIEVWISAYQDGELDPGRRRRVEEHLATCCPCRELVAEWTALERSLRAEMTRFDAPETLHERVMRQIPEERPTAAPLGRRGSWTPGGWFSFGLAPIGALTAWMLWTGHPMSSQVGKKPTPAAVMQAQSPSGGTDVEPVKVMTPTPPAPGVNPKVGPGKEAQKGIGPKLPGRAGPTIRSNESGSGTRNRPDPLRELRRLRSRRPYYHLAFDSSPGRYGHRRHWHRRRPQTLLAAAKTPVPLVTVPQPPESPEHRLAAVPRFRVTDYVLPQVPTPTDAAGSETEFVLRRAAATEPTQVAYQF